MKQKNFNIPAILRNKYGISVLLFSIWMVFFDENKLWQQITITREYHKIKKEMRFFESEIASNTQGIKQLSDDPKLLEKLARERYMMKKNNEDVYLIIPE